MAEHNGGNRGGNDRGTFPRDKQFRRRSARIPFPGRPEFCGPKVDRAPVSASPSVSGSPTATVIT